jgi:hypothetical protein
VRDANEEQVAELAGADQPPRLGEVGVEAALETHLEDDAGGCCECGRTLPAGQVDRQRLLAEHVLARVRRLLDHLGVERAGRGYHDGRHSRVFQRGLERCRERNAEPAGRRLRERPVLIDEPRERGAGDLLGEVPRMKQADRTESGNRNSWRL